MSNKGLIEQIIEAIDRGEEIDIDLENITDAADQAKIKALLSVHQISRRIKQKQVTALENSFNAGDQWMHLIIKEKVGSGGFGHVYRAYDSVLETDVAVKFLHDSVQVLDEFAFLREARLMATVRNPHVLAIHGAAKDHGVSGYWSDYLDGEILFTYLAQNVLSDQQKISIIKDLVMAVKATHENEVVHGDIKSLNVMLQPNRGAILLDFGSGRSGVINSENSQLLQASPIAMAPEQFAGESNSQAADVYSLGLLILEILTGKHPFLNQTLEQIKEKCRTLSNNLSDLNVPTSWHNLLSEMLSEDAKQRPVIKSIEHSIIAIEEKPLKRAKRVALISTVALLLGVTGSSLYSYFTINQANQQTEVINEILYNNFLTIESYTEGKSVTLVQVMDRVGDKVIENQDLTKENKEKLLVRMVGTYLTLSDLEHVIELGNQVLALPDLHTLSRMKVLRYIGLAHSHRREYSTAEPFFNEIINLNAQTVEEYDAQLKAINPIVFGYLNQEKFNEIPAVFNLLEALQPHGSNRPIMLGAIEHTKAMYYSDTNNHLESHNSYIKAAGHYTQHYHPDHYSVLQAYSMAATQYINSNDAILRQVGISDLKNLMPKMKETMGVDHNNYMIAQINLASGYSQNNEADLALEILLGMQQQVYEKVGRDNLMSLLLFDATLAQSYAADKQLEKAEQTYNEIKRKLSIHHKDDLQSIIRAALLQSDFYLQNNMFSKAKSLATEYLQIATQQFSAEHRLSLELEARITQVDYVSENNVNIQQLEEIYSRHVEFLGATDHQTLALKKTIEELKTNRIQL